MAVLDRYLFRIIGQAILAVLLVILGLDALIILVDEMTETRAGYGTAQVLLYILFKLPASLSEYAPYAALIGVMAGLGLLANRGELTVIRAVGVPIVRVAWMVVKPALVLVLVVLLVSEFVAPSLEQRAEGERSLKRGDGPQIEEDGLWMFDQGAYVHVNAVYPDGRLYGVSRYHVDFDETTLEVRQAEQSQFDISSQQWHEREVRWTSVRPESVISGSESGDVWRTKLHPNLLNMSALDATQMSIRDLGRFSSYLRGEGTAQAREYEVEYWKKLFTPLSIASLVFVGMSFVLGSNRQVTLSERVFVGVMVSTAFRLLQDIFGPAAVVWGFHALWAVGIPIVLTTVLGCVLIRLRT